MLKALLVIAGSALTVGARIRQLASRLPPPGSPDVHQGLAFYQLRGGQDLEISPGCARHYRGRDCEVGLLKVHFKSFRFTF